MNLADEGYHPGMASRSVEELLAAADELDRKADELESSAPSTKRALNQAIAALHQVAIRAARQRPAPV